MKTRKYDKVVEVLKQKHIEHWYTQIELAKRSGYSQKHISYVFNFKKNPSIQFIYDMKHPLGIDPSELCNMIYLW